MTNVLLGCFTVLLVVAVYSCCLSVVARDVQGAVVVEDSEDAEAVVAKDWEGEDVVEGASDAVVVGDGENAEADNREIDMLLLGPAWAGCSATRPCSSESSVTSAFFGSEGRFAVSSEIRKFSISSEVRAGINTTIIAGS